MGTEGENSFVEHFFLRLDCNPVFDLAFLFPSEFRPEQTLNLGCVAAAQKDKQGKPLLNLFMSLNASVGEDLTK